MHTVGLRYIYILNRIISCSKAIYNVEKKKSRVQETPTLSTNADSKTDTILRGYVICIKVCEK